MKAFIDEFKHLEKICNEIYCEQHGVTQYINEMEQKSGYASRKIPNCDNDLASLKRVRHIRNNLVHESDETVDYNNSDIKFIKAFYRKIITQQDPLALLQKQKGNTTDSKINNRVSDSVTHPTVDVADEEESSLTKTLICGIVVAVLILVLL